LKEAITQSKFREDLYYRLNVIHLNLPPLRQRRDDIPLLAQRFLEQATRRHGRSNVPMIHPEAIEYLMGYYWPGNIRELKNIMERMVVLDRTGTIRASDLPAELGVRRS